MIKLFNDHIKQQLDHTHRLLEKYNYDSLIVDSGMPIYYFQDDQTMPFKPNAHFTHYCPDRGPGHLIQIEKGKKPKLFYFSPDDFWHDVSTFDNPFWADSFDVTIINQEDQLWKNLNISQGKHCCSTPQPEKAIDVGLEIIHDEFHSALNWSRLSKSEYEIECIKGANKIAAKGHLAAKKAFFSGMSERETYQRYMEATLLFEHELPYGNIIAFDEKAAILHYHGARDTKPGKTFLIDAGATFYGYCSDITRTYCTDQAHDSFSFLIEKVEEIQQEICGKIKPGVDYRDLNSDTHIRVAEVLIEANILKGLGVDQALDMDLTSPFLPHGLGHALGIQVHDVAGKQMDEDGTPAKVDQRHPYLRTLRKIQNNDVLTVEPGIYFIPMLLKDYRSDPSKNVHLNNELIDQLIPLGGIRIEDNVVARESGPENLTRPFLP